MDLAIHRDALPAMAGRLSERRSHLAQGRCTERISVAKQSRCMASVALLCSTLSMVNGGRRAMNYVTFVDSPIGRLSLYSDGEALTGLYMEKREPPGEW